LLDHVLELADVAGEVVAHEVVDHALAELDTAPHLARVLVDEVLDQERDVLATLAERGENEARDVEAVVEVEAEALVGDRLLQILVRRRDDPHVDRHGLVVAEAADLAFLDRAQQLRLEGRLRLRDLVEEERAAVGLLEETAARGDRAGVRPTHVAEELALEERLAHGGAVHRDEGLVGPQRVRVDRARHELLARAALTRDEHGRVGRRDAHDASEHVPDRRGAADDVGEAVALAEARRHRAHRARELSLLDRALDLHEQLFFGEGLLDVVVRADAHGLDGTLDRAVRRHDQHLGHGRRLLHVAQDVEAVLAGHAEVGEDEIERVAVDALTGLVTVGSLGHLVARTSQHERERGAHVPLVVDDEDLRHGPGA
jgi:hypothetical protein